MKPDFPAKRKILVRGGSIAAGCGVKTNYVDILRRRYLHRNVEIINRSRKGETSFDAVHIYSIFLLQMDRFLSNFNH